MKDKLTLLFLCLLVLGLAQDDGCEELRLAQIQTGEIVLNPNDLGTAGSNKNYYESLERGKFGKTDWLGTAVALAGFETNCGQSHYSLVVDIAEPQNENTKLKLVIDFRNQAKDSLTTWTKVKLSYLVASAQRFPTGLTSAHIWATSQTIDVATFTNKGPGFRDPIFSPQNPAIPAVATDDNGCGLFYDSAASALKFRFGVECSSTAAGTSPAYDVAAHVYIMGFQYQPDAASSQYYIGANVRFDNTAASGLIAGKKEVVWSGAGGATVVTSRSTTDYRILLTYADQTANWNGPSLMIDNMNNELKTIKVALVLTVINPIQPAAALKNNGFDATTLSYSYSGLYSDIVSPSRFNIKTIIDNTDSTSFFRLKEKIPGVKYMIYGFNSFALKDQSGCSSFSMDLNIDTVNSYTITVNQAAYVEQVAF